MEVNYNVTGEARKKLVSEIARITGSEARYMRVPTCNYEIGNFTVTRTGALVFDGRVDVELVQQVLEGLEKAGFTFEQPFGLFDAEATESETLAETTTTETDDTEETETDAGDEEDAKENAEENASEPQQECVELTVQMPRETFTDTALENLKKLTEAKAALICKALAVESLPIEVTETAVSFPWFAEVDVQDAPAYTHFISALCEMAKTQKRIAAKEKEVENEKYAFRCFLLRLGFIGGEYKTERKILLRNLTGSSAFKGGARNEISE